MRHPDRILIAAVAGVAVCLVAGGALRGAGGSLPAPGAGAAANPPAALRAGAAATRPEAAATRAARLAPVAPRRPDAPQPRAKAQAAGAMAGTGGNPPARAVAAPPRLERPWVEPGAVTVSLRGFDPGAPRDLTLWRVHPEGAARLAGIRSAPDGRFAFPEIAVIESELAVTAADEPPERAQGRVQLAALPTGPVTATRSRAAGVETLQVWPSAAAARVLVGSAGAEAAPRAVALRPGGGERVVTLAIDASEASGALFVTEEDAQGRRADWIRLEAAP